MGVPGYPGTGRVSIAKPIDPIFRARASTSASPSLKGKERPRCPRPTIKKNLRSNPADQLNTSLNHPTPRVAVQTSPSRSIGNADKRSDARRDARPPNQDRRLTILSKTDLSSNPHGCTRQPPTTNTSHHRRVRIGAFPALFAEAWILRHVAVLGQAVLGSCFYRRHHLGE